MFWDLVREDPKSASELLGDLSERLMTYLEPKHSGGAVLIESLLNTVHFLTLFVDVKFGDAKIKKQLQAWKVKEKDPDYARKSPSAKLVMATLVERAGSDELVERLVITAFTLASQDDFKSPVEGCMASIPTTDPDAWRPSDGTFAYPYLKRLAEEDRKAQASILNAIVQKLSSVPSLAVLRKAAEAQLMALLHMLKSFMAVGPVSDKTLLAKAAASVTQFYFWPEPFGGLAKSMLQMLQRETIAPGTAFRNRLLSECKKAYLRGFPNADAQEYALVHSLECPCL
jgi:hypothetical protein